MECSSTLLLTYVHVCASDGGPQLLLSNILCMLSVVNGAMGVPVSRQICTGRIRILSRCIEIHMSVVKVC